MKNSFVLMVILSSFMFSQNSYALDAGGNGEWMSLGVPLNVHLNTDGEFYLKGTAHGTCAGVNPTYFRVNMADPHWKEFYGLVLYMSAQQLPMDCFVASGCGTSSVWVKFCRGDISQ